MIARSSTSTCVKIVSHLSGRAQRQMTGWIPGVTPQAPSGPCCFSFATEISVLKTNKFLSIAGVQAVNVSCFRRSMCKQGNSLYTSSVGSIISSKLRLKTCLRKSFGSEHMTLRRIVCKHGMAPRITCNSGFSSWLQGFVPALIFGFLVSYSTSQPVHAEAFHAKRNKDGDCDSSSAMHSHGKEVYTDYSIIGIPGDGRCMFRSVAHGACVRSGKPAPNEETQRELADELRANVANEFIKRRKETEWFIEGDFDTYVSQIRKPHVWGGEPELLMASHVLRMPITVYMYDKDSGGLISIAEYGQEYGKENPIDVLYHGFGHYDALQIHANKGARSKL